MPHRVRWFLRALRLRCPLCGAPWPRRLWIVLAPECPNCDLHLERRENDYFLGAYTLNLFASLLVVTLIAAAGLWWRPAPPWGGVLVSALIVIAALGFYPLTKLFWLAIDLQFRPPITRDFEEVSEKENL